MINLLINNLGHIVAGFVLCYLFIPKAELWVLISFTAGFAAVREYIQFLRKHSNGGKYGKYTDALGWIIGAIIYYFIAKKGYIDADKGYQSTLLNYENN